MRRRFKQRLRIGVSPREVALVAGAGGQLSVLAEQRCADSAIDTICAGVASLLSGAGCDGWPVTLVVADELARMWQVTPPPGSSRLADLDAASGLRFLTLYGESPANWAIASAYDAVAPFMAAALPRQLLALLAQACAAHQLKVIEIVPQFVAGWNRWRGVIKADSWYGLAHDKVLTIRAAGAPRAIAIPAGAGSGWLSQQVEREALRLNIPAPQRLMVSGDAPEAWGNGGMCTLLHAGAGADWSPGVWLAATGSAA
jgi:hypothetical protein